MVRIGGRLWTAWAVLALAGCQPPPPQGAGEETREKVVIERSRAAGAERITAEIHIGAGELRLSGGAKELLEAEFEYNVAALKPQVRFDETGFRRRLVITQGGTQAIGGIVNRWDIRLGGDVPLDLVVRCGAGENRLDLREAPVRSLELDLGVGEATVDLRREWTRDVDAKIKGGIGRAVVLVPSGGVEARASGGIGEIRVEGLRKEDGRWVSEGLAKAGARLRLEVTGGIGQIEIRAE